MKVQIHKTILFDDNCFITACNLATSLFVDDSKVLVQCCPNRFRRRSRIKEHAYKNGTHVLLPRARGRSTTPFQNNTRQMHMSKISRHLDANGKALNRGKILQGIPHAGAAKKKCGQSYHQLHLRNRLLQLKLERECWWPHTSKKSCIMSENCSGEPVWPRKVVIKTLICRTSSKELVCLIRSKKLCPSWAKEDGYRERGKSSRKGRWGNMLSKQSYLNDSYTENSEHNTQGKPHPPNLLIGEDYHSVEH